MPRVERLLLLHTNDVHGRVDGLSRVATVVERVRSENPDAAVVYVDAGDVEEATNRLSNLTKGAALHRLLDAIGCRAVAVGNGAVLRYGHQVLVGLAAVSSYPHLAANLLVDGDVVPGAKASALVTERGVRVGLVGLTPTNFRDIYERIFGLELPPAAPIVVEHARRLRDEGAEVVVLLSHVGLDADRELAPQVKDVVDVIVGSHSHSLLPEGELVEGLLIAQAGEYAQHLGIVELLLRERVEVAGAHVLAVADDVPPAPRVEAEIATIERELEESLAEVVGELEEELELSDERECAAANFMADVVRARMEADVGVITSATSFDATLPAGPLTRRVLYESCSSAGVCGVTTLTGSQLRQLVAKGLDPELAADVPRSFRGRRRGFMHLSGAAVRDGELLVAGEPVDPSRAYRVAGSDWELDTYGGYAEREWALRIDYDMPYIMREAVEDNLRASGPVATPPRRVHSRLA